MCILIFAFRGCYCLGSFILLDLFKSLIVFPFWGTKYETLGERFSYLHYILWCPARLSDHENSVQAVSRFFSQIWYYLSSYVFLRKRHSLAKLNTWYIKLFPKPVGRITRTSTLWEAIAKLWFALASRNLFFGNRKWFGKRHPIIIIEASQVLTTRWHLVVNASALANHIFALWEQRLIQTLGLRR